jgi:hypothetical protein
MPIVKEDVAEAVLQSLARRKAAAARPARMPLRTARYAAAVVGEVERAAHRRARRDPVPRRWAALRE